MLLRLCVACLGFVDIAGWSALQIQQMQQMQSMQMIQTVPVPDFTGKSLSDVQAANLVPGTHQMLFSGVASQGPTDGIVVSQTPLPNTRILPGRSRLLVTLGPRQPNMIQKFFGQLMQPPKRQTTIPGIIGETRARAAADLDAAHLRATFIGDDAGVVVQQNPLEGTPVAIGSTVSVTLQVPQVTVPNLYSMHRGEAAELLAANSLRMGNTFGDLSAESTVTEQSIPAGTQVDSKTSVDLTFAAPAPRPGGPQETPPPAIVHNVVVPNLIGMNFSLANVELRRIGLRCQPFGDMRTGTVSQQTPEPGSLLDRGALVQLTFVAQAERQRPPWTRISVDGLRGAATALLVVLLLAAGALIRMLRKPRPQKPPAIPFAVPTFQLDPRKEAVTRSNPQQHVVQLAFRFRSRDGVKRTDTKQQPTVTRRR